MTTTIHGTAGTAGNTAGADALLRLLRAVEANQPDLYGHGEAVARHCAEVARAFGLAGAELEAIAVAGQLHDVGKAGIDESVLLKPAPLTSEEWEQVRLHPQIGANLTWPAGSVMSPTGSSPTTSAPTAPATRTASPTSASRCRRRSSRSPTPTTRCAPNASTARPSATTRPRPNSARGRAGSSIRRSSRPCWRRPSAAQTRSITVATPCPTPTQSEAIP